MIAGRQGFALAEVIVALAVGAMVVPLAGRAVRDRHARRGFTLVEVMVALTVGALVVLMADRLFESVAVGGQELRRARVTLDRAANARRWLTATMLSVEVPSSDGGEPFGGNPDGMTFCAWQETPGGWFVPRHVILARVEARFVAVVNGDSVVLADSVESIGFDYLILEGDGGGSWVHAWTSGLAAPVAVRVRILTPAGGDTSLFLVKERG